MLKCIRSPVHITSGYWTLQSLLHKNGKSFHLASYTETGGLQKMPQKITDVCPRLSKSWGGILFPPDPSQHQGTYKAIKTSPAFRRLFIAFRDHSGYITSWRKPKTRGPGPRIMKSILVTSCRLEKCNLCNYQFIYLYYIYTLQGTNISHLGKRKHIFKSAFKMGYVSSQEGIRYVCAYIYIYSIWQYESMEITGFPFCFTLPSWFIHTNMELWKHPRHTARCNWANSPWHCVQRPRSPPDSWPLWRCHCKEVHTQVHLSHRWLDPQKLAGMIRYQIFDQVQYTTWKGSMAQLPLVLVYHSPLLFATELGCGVAPSILSLRCTQMVIPAWTRSYLFLSTARSCQVGAGFCAQQKPALDSATPFFCGDGGNAHRKLHQDIGWSWFRYLNP